jgi:hypothetical protein
MKLSSDFEDLLREFADEQVRFLIVGAYAVAYHADPRYTKDLDIWIEPTKANGPFARSRRSARRSRR